jgi:hypothetical protein
VFYYFIYSHDNQFIWDVQQTDRRHFRKIEEVLNGYVTNPNPTPTLTLDPNLNPNSNPNRINKKIQKEKSANRLTN